MQQMGSWEVGKGNSIWKSIADWKSFSRHPNFPIAEEQKAKIFEQTLNI
jgi:hypothetical protein